MLPEKPERRDFLRHPWVPLSVVLVVYGLLVLPTVAHQGISWDEQTDITIARAYLAAPDGWLAGSPDDPSQTRLPMFVVALVYKLLGRSDLITGRVVSVLVGALTLVAVYLYGRRRFDPVRGLVACALLATSPFFLSFARVAFTETDVYLACALAWLLVCADRLRERPTIGRAAWVGVAFGLALSAKATILVVLPAIWFAVWQSKADDRADRARRGRGWEIVVLLGGMAVCIAGGLRVANWAALQVRRGDIRLLDFLAMLAGWLLVLSWVGWRRRQTASPFLLAAFATGLAALTFFVLPPDHLTNPAILRGLNRRLDHDMSLRPGLLAESAALHLLCVLFKPGLLIGAGMVSAMAVTIWQWRRRREIRLPVLVVLGYSAGLILLPLAQTFYTIPILPVLVVLAADQFLRLHSRRRKIALGLAGLAVLTLGIDIGRCYPDYNFNGYQWLGARVIARRSTVGYRSVVQTPSDGVAQAFDWLNGHAGPGEDVLAYVLSWHIVHAVAPDPAYRLADGIKTGVRGGASETGGEKAAVPEFVVTEINAQIPQNWWTWPGRHQVFDPPYDPVWLEREYTKVFSVRRAYGIEMASVWRKK